MKKILILLSIFVISGCASTYKHSELQPIDKKLDHNKAVVISIPKDGVYGRKQYPNSGKMTANAVKAAFSKFATQADIDSNCNINCLNILDKRKYGYYIKPEILHWEDRATEWSGIPDRIEIQIGIYDISSGKELASSTYTGKSKWATFGGDHPQDLLEEPTEQYVNSLY